MKHKILSLLTLLVVCVTGAWADVTLFSTDFTESGWGSLNSESTAQTLTIGSQTVYVRANNTGNLLSVDTSTGTLTWGNRNFSNKDCYLAIPVSGVNGSITVSVANGTSATRVTYAASTSSTVANPSSVTNSTSANPTTFTIENIKGDFLMVYLGRQGSGLTMATSITITTPASAVTYAVTYANGGHGTAPSATTGSTFSLPTMEADGDWSNTGWTANEAVTVAGNSVSAGTIIPVGTSVTISKATAFTGVWQKTISPSLSYDNTTLVLTALTSANPTLSGNTGSGTVTYTSSDPSVATVNSSTGVVTAVAAGTTTIKASVAADGDYAAGEATATIKVAAAPVGLIDQKLATGEVAWDASVIVTEDYTNIYDLTALSQHGSATASGNGNTNNGGQTSKIGTAAAENADNYLELSFTVADGKLLDVTSITIPVQPVKSNTNNFKAVLSDNQGSTEIVGTKTNITNGTLENIVFTSYGTMKGTVILRIYAWGWTDGYRLGKNIVIDGTIEDDSDDLTIRTQPADADYVQGAVASALTVEVVKGSAPYTYQWYSCDDVEKTNPVVLNTSAEIAKGSQSASYTPSTEATGYYYCVVTDNASAEVTSDVATITITPPAAPTNISVSANNASVFLDASVTLTASVTGGVPEPTIKWYSCTNNEKAGAEEIISARGEETYSPSTAAAGTFYFYATASNSVGEISSSVVVITVTDPDKYVSGNEYFMSVGETPLPDENIYCNDITMTFVNGKSGESFTAGVADAMISGVNPSFVASITGSSSNNGWKARFVPKLNGTLSVGVIINKNKTFSITNVSAFHYEGKNGSSEDVSESVDENSITTANDDAAKLYVIVTISVVSGTTYDFSVGGSKMGFYGFEFTPASHSIAATPDYYATFCAPYKVSMPDGVKAYTASYAAVDETTGQLTLNEWGSNVIPASLPVILKGSSTSFTLTATSEDVIDFVGTNNLHGTTEETDASAISTAYVLGVVNGTTGFYRMASGNNIPANRAYLIISGGAAAAPQVIRIVEGENNATSVEEIQSAEEVVKFIENGQLLIKKNGIVYDAFGRIVK